ncbi:STAS domain-containing protein [Streptomyces sp. Ag109_O5-10]|uniref:STAS domain-containing protein n=1 Tax=Streptomyces sp. Ag109_O5-10 TaxID=1855349 RepID=UPI000899519C|nr:STAS domain-containing protein [Streptomyces sp. Ag109_O5-10]SEF15554.1 anti-anti-sigma factor [Streptomyces sp. Ag109_O5-10]
MADDQETVGRGELAVVRADVDGIAVLGVRGEIDYQSVGVLTRAMPPADPTTGPRVVVDLSEVTFMDSSGVNALVAAHHATRAVRGWLRLAGAHGPVLRTVQLVGLDAVAPCHPTVAEAIAA